MLDVNRPLGTNIMKINNKSSKTLSFGMITLLTVLISIGTAFLKPLTSNNQYIFPEKEYTLSFHYTVQEFHNLSVIEKIQHP